MPQTSTALVVDDEDLIRWSLGQRLERDGHRVLEAASGAEALERAAGGVDVVLVDYGLPDMDGLTLLDRIRDEQPDTPVILITAFSTVERAVDAVRRGAFHFVTKPFDVDEVAALVDRALETTRLRREIRDMRARQSAEGALDNIIGESPRMQEAKGLLAKYARSPTSTVLITGESGTGKDMAARAIHAESDRAGRPFMNITCSALPENLLESELFGHERGAFTDAKQQKKGLLEQAHGGTVFLDEIGEMTQRLQAKVLRFLEDRVFRRVGGSGEIQPDVRVVAATNRDLREAVHAGEFREDLFYRLSVLHVHMPPLRERGGDVELLAKYFVDRFDREFRKRVRRIAPSAMRVIRSHDWPGNVRELRNVVERAVLLCEGEGLGPEDLGGMHGPAAEADGGHLWRLPAGGVDLQELEKDLVIQALERTSGNQTRAAALLGMNRDQIRYRIEKFGLRGGGK